MDISYHWLRQYVELDLSPEDLAETLTMGGLEVDDIAGHSVSADGVIVGKITAVRPHPNADRLVLCDVNVGTGDQLQIACGAPNVAEGQMAPVATTGTTLQFPSRNDPEVREPVTIKKTELRGETSEGMICSEDELGLSADHSGIMVLDEGAEIGQRFQEYLADRDIEAHDSVFDIELTPNRPDAASHLGVARDAAALTAGTLQRPQVDLPNEGGAAADEVSVSIDAPDACPRYVAVLVRGVSVGPSPLWLQHRLRSIGLQPRNNIVDVTNFVLHECGQPLHAFDLNRLSGPAIRVRLTEEEETFTTLDDVKRELPPGTLLICDAESPVAVAGVMGGANSEVSEETTDVLIESAFFDPSTIRRTAKALGLQTDASYRFERGVNRDGQRWAAARAAELMTEVAGGEIVNGCVDEHPRPLEPATVDLRMDRLEKVLGVAISLDEANGLLQSIEFETEVFNDGTLRCTVPSFRPDVAQEEDLIEEVARLHGYDRIPEPAAGRIPSRTPRAPASERLRRQTRELLAGLGFAETYTNSLMSQSQAEQFADPETIVHTLNPISREMAAMRPSLLPEILQVVRHNRHHGRESLRFVEWGHVYRRSNGTSETQSTDLISGYHEHESLLLTLTGPHAPAGWDVTPRPSDIYDLKGVVETMLDNLGLSDATMASAHRGSAAAGAVAGAGTGAGAGAAEETAARAVAGAGTPFHHRLVISVKGDPIGMLAQLSDKAAGLYDLEESPLFVAEFNWDRLVSHSSEGPGTAYRAAPRFPVVDRDLAVVVHRSQPVGDLLTTIREAGGSLLQNVGVFDLYEGEHIAADHKSVAFSLRFGADRTLRDEEVDESVASILQTLEDRHDASLRQ